MKVFVVTTIKTTIDYPVTIGVFTDRSKAEQAAIESLIATDGILEELITFRKEHNYQDPITKRQDGSTTIWGHRRERMDWSDRDGFVIAAQLTETFLLD